MVTAYDKFITAIAGVIADAITQGLINGTAAKWTNLVIALLTALAVLMVPNKTTDQPVTQP